MVFLAPALSFMLSVIGRGQFMIGVELAFFDEEAHPGHVILLGAPATFAATDYGWIEAKAASSEHSPASFMRVKRFWERPARHVAEGLLESRCVWNTFVMLGPSHNFSESGSIRQLFTNYSPSAITITHLFDGTGWPNRGSERSSC